METKIHLITGNKGKLLAAQKAFDRFNITLNQIDKDYPEIQGKNSLEIAKFTAIQAAKDFNVVVVREDHSLFIKSLGGFPGPYTSYFDKTIPAEKLLELMLNFEDRSAYMELAAVLAYPDGTSKEYVYQVPLKISSELKGDRGNWDKILMLTNNDKTFAETTEEDNVETWLKNFEAIAKEFSE
jgi:XTP/dITP diphosphohydrolase